MKKTIMNIGDLPKTWAWANNRIDSLWTWKTTKLASNASYKTSIRGNKETKKNIRCSVRKQIKGVNNAKIPKIVEDHTTIEV